MNNLLKKWHIFWWNNFITRAEESEYLFVPFCLLSIISFGMFYIFNELGYKLYEQEVLIPRLASVVMCILLLFKNYWPIRLQGLKFYLWYLLLTFTTPFFDFYIVVTNNFNDLLILNFIIGVFQVIILTDLFISMFLIPIGIGAACLAYMFMYGSEHISFAPLMVQDMIYLLYIFAVSAFLIYMRNNSQRDKLQSIENFSNVIAHEMRTPLRTIASYSKVIKQHLSKLISNNVIITSYLESHPEILKELNLDRISKVNYQSLHDAINTIREETKNSFLVIDIILMQMSIKSTKPTDMTVFPIKQMLEESIHRYNFFPQEKMLLHINMVNDFIVMGNKTLLLHVMFNLFKNALYVIKKHNKGAIYIWTSKNDKYNELHFRDTSIGIPASSIPFIFNSFYSSKNSASGIGLAYCKQVMELIRGKISCYSEYGKFTEFTLYFPIVSSN